MKIFVLQGKDTTQSGYGRYSLETIRALKQSGIEVVVSDIVLPQPLNYRKNYFFAFWYAWKLRKYAKGCDAIHCFIEAYSYITYWLSWFTGKKYFITAHGTYGVLPYYQSKWRRFFHIKSFSKARKVICVSGYTKRALEKIGITNTHVIHNGIDFNKFYQIPVRSFDQRENVVLSVGALKHRKGQHVSLQAFANIAKKIKDVKYFFVGSQNDKTYFERLKKIVVGEGIEDRVEFFSSITDVELFDLYRKAKVFVLTSLSEKNNFEGFGLVYLEANASGVPVIGSYESGAEDAIKTGKTGLLAPQNDLSIIENSITLLLSNKDSWTRMNKEAVEWAKIHDINEIIKEYIKIYKEI
ncbi:MAG: hypothetical protein RJA61_581 [Candidatus Parcubacteria bacterium]|jgi:phosphatidylinositol alpha-1,6-mannosyltransferase